MFRISRRLDYGIQMMVTLAKLPENQTLATAIMADKLSIPLPFLHQIGHTLMQNRMVLAIPGPRGGLRLNRHPGEINLLEIAEALEGPLSVNICTNCDGACQQDQDCAQRTIWTELQQGIMNYLRSVTLDMLANQENQRLLLPSSVNTVEPAVFPN